MPPRPVTYRKPPAGARLAAGHPLASLLSGAYLLNDGTGRYKNLGAGRGQSPAGGGNTDLVSGAAGFTPNRPGDRGAGVRFDGTGYLAAGNPSQAYANTTGATPGWSLAVKFRLASLAATGGVISLGNTATSGVPAYLLQNNGSTNLRVLMGDVAYRTLVSGQSTGVWYTVVSTFSGVALKNDVTGTESHYVGVYGSAAQVYSGSLTCASAANFTGTNLYVASGFNAAVACDVEFVYLWDRELKYREALDLIRDPYQVWEVRGLAAVGSVGGGGGGGRTKKNTRAWPLGTRIGMDWRVPH